VGSGTSGTAFWISIAALLAVVVVGGVIVMWARRNAKAPDEGPQQAFTLEDLRRMHERGELSKREFETARDALIQRTREAARRAPPPRGGSDWENGRDSGPSARR
jgi:hypothetical protein